MSSYSIKSLEHYFKVYRQSVRKPKKFWGKIAENNFTWYRKWDKVLEYDMERAEFTWYKNAKLNITKNCIDRHLANKGDETAIIFEPNDPEEPARRYTYSELYAEVSKIVISAIPFVTPTKPTYASLPFPGIQPVLMDDLRNEIEQNQKSGNLCIAYPWPGMARTIWGDHQRFIDTYFTKFPGKIMRRILRRIAEGESDFGDITTLVNPEIVEEILHERL